MRTNARAGHSARFVKKMKSNPGGARRRAQRAAAYRTAMKRGMNKNSARRSALRRVPFSGTERRSGASFAGSRAHMRRNQEGIPMKKKASRAKRVSQTAKTRAIGGAKTRAVYLGPRKPPTEKQKAAWAKAGKRLQRARKAQLRKKHGKQYKTVPVTRRRKKTVTRVVATRGKKRVRVRYGKYKRVVMTNPWTGRREYSYMYRGKGGKLRRIPTKVIVGKSEKLKERVSKGRMRAGKRLLKYGGPFVMNANKKRKKARKSKKGGSAAQRRAGRRLAAYAKAKARGLSKSKARAAAVRAVPLRGSDSFGGKLGKSRKRKARKMKRSKAKRRGRHASGQTTKQLRARKRNIKKAQAARRRKGKKGGKKRSKKTSKRRKSRKGRKGTKKMKANRRRRRTASRTTTRRRRRRSSARSMAPNRRRRRRSRKGRKAYASNRRRRRSRRGYRRNSIGALFMTVMKAGLLITAGFVTHKLLTNLVINYLIPALKPAPAAATQGWDYATFEKPIVGLGVLAIGLPLTNVVAKGKVIQLGAGMFASWAHSLIMSVVTALDTTGKVAPQLGDYPSGMAWQLRGGRRGYSGLGARNAGSIMPRYRQVGQYRQASAGMGQYRQAAAGTGWLGEYFQASSVGEYFAPPGIQGVGDYEPAGPLAMQATTPQSIDDGIRPDANLDVVMDLAEAAAGLHGPRTRDVSRYLRGSSIPRGYATTQYLPGFIPNPSSPRLARQSWTGGMGEYITAAQQNGAWNEATVPTNSQWIPNGPLWAGTLGVKDTQDQADLPAGILAGPGGNGTLSGG